MEFGYLHVCCGPYRILVPAENVAGVDPDVMTQLVRVPLRQARRLGWPLVVDARALLGLSAAGSGEPRVNIHWRRTDDTIGAVLVVDRADSLRSGVDADFLPLPRVPRAFHDLFDRLLFDDGRFMIRLRRDISLRLDDRASRRRFCRAVLGAVPPENSQALAIEASL